MNKETLDVDAEEDKMIKKAEEDFVDASETDPKWEMDEIKEDAEVVKLQIGESIEGLLTDMFKSTKYNAMIYKIKIKDKDLAQIIVGTTLLDKLMLPKVVGDEVKIKRLDDTVNKKGQAIHNWETYHLHKSSSL